MKEELLHPGHELVPVSADDFPVLHVDLGGFIDVSPAFVRWLDVPTPDGGLRALASQVERLRLEWPSLYRVFQLRYGSGLTCARTAAELGCSPRTVERKMAQARTIVQGYARERDSYHDLSSSRSHAGMRST